MNDLANPIFSDETYVGGKVKTAKRGQTSPKKDAVVALVERGITGVYKHVSQQHLKRYLGEFDFRYNTRHLSDMERAVLAAKGIAGKRLTYRRPDQARHA